MAAAVELVASDGHRLSAYRADPPGRARGAVVVLQEIFGVNDHIRAVTDGFADDGYVAIAPALFDRLRRGVELGYSAEAIAVGVDLRRRTDLDGAMRDIAAAAASAEMAVGVVGYCLGGFLAWIAAARVHGLACAVSYYGGGVLEHATERPRCPVMLHFSDRDDATPVAGVQSFAAAHPEQAVHVYAAEHGFNCDHRAAHHEPAASLARQRTLAFMGLHLG